MMAAEFLREYLRASANVNHLWARLIVAELWRCGVRSFVLGPGSRSTPLAMAVAEFEAPDHARTRPFVTVHVDERGGAFYALGAGRCSETTPTVWITTSGTAVANGMPAAVEADVAGVPLLLVTADRPHELRETGANQTIRQPGLFGSVVRWAFDGPVPTASIDPTFVLTTVDHAVARSRGRPGPPGPVHLNLPFREPLAPIPHERDEVLALVEQIPPRWFADLRQPYTTVTQPLVALGEYEIERLVQRLKPVERGVVTAGSLALIPGLGLGKLAAHLGWPLLPDVLSNARLARGTYANPNLVPYFDLVLASERFRAAYKPQAVLHAGARPTSKRLQTWIDAAAPNPYLVAHDGPGRMDPAHRVTHQLQGWTGGLLESLKEALDPQEGGEWLRDWQTASDAVAETLDELLGDDRLTEPRVARLITERIGEGQSLFAAASMPVRDLNSFAIPDGDRAFVAANRGASGIDGTVASAVGFTGHRPINGPGVLLIGDLALLHDLNSLAMLREGPPLIIVVINNDGGGIFHFLPVAPGRREGALPADVFEPFFGAPHGLRFEHAARMFGLDYARPESASAFVEAFDAAQRRSETTDDRGNVYYRHGCSTLIEVVTDRVENATLHRAITERCAQAVDTALGL